jgi:hypothetical protein
MAILMVGYDLNKPDADYTKLIERLKSKPNWWHHLDSTWLVITAQTPVQLRDELRQLIDGNDELLVIDVTGDAGAWVGFDETGSAWLKENL